MKRQGLVFLVMILMSGASFARSAGNGALLTLNGFIDQNKTEQGSSTSETKSTLWDLKFGRVFSNGFYLGGIYGSKSTSDGATATDGKYYGGSVGYMGASGFFGQAHYLLSAELGTLSEGSGFQVDVGYLTEVSSSVVVGVELRYQTIDYKKNGGVSMAETLKITGLLPMLTVGFVF